MPQPHDADGSGPTWGMEPVARRLGDGRELTGWAGTLVLPDLAHPQIVLRRASNGEWLVEQGELCGPVSHGAALDLAGERWELDLSGRAPPASPAEPLNLRFQVDGEQSRVAMTVTQGAARAEISAAPAIWPIYALARDRMRARRRGVDADEAGWVGLDELARHLASTTSALVTRLWRLRASLSAAGLPDAGAILQGDAMGRLRLGTDRVEIEKTD